MDRALITWIKIDSSLSTNNEQSFENELLSHPRQFKWSTDSKDSFTFALTSDEIKQLIQEFDLLTDFEQVGDFTATSSLRNLGKYQKLLQSNCLKL